MEALLYPFSSHDSSPNPSFWLCGLQPSLFNCYPPIVPGWEDQADTWSMAREGAMNL